MTVRIAPVARRELQAIWTYSEATWGRAQADSYVAELRLFFERLANVPALGRPLKGASKPYLRAEFGSHVVLFNRPGSDTVFIARILHGRQDILRHV